MLFYRKENPSPEFLTDFDEFSPDAMSDSGRFLRIVNTDYFLVQDSLHVPKLISIVSDLNQQGTLISIEHRYGSSPSKDLDAKGKELTSNSVQYAPRVELTGLITDKKSFTDFCDYSLLHTAFSDVQAHSNPVDHQSSYSWESQDFSGEFGTDDITRLTEETIAAEISIEVNDRREKTCIPWFDKNRQTLCLRIFIDRNTLDHLIDKLESGDFCAVVTDIFLAEWKLVHAKFKGHCGDLEEAPAFLIPSLTDPDDLNDVSIQLWRKEPLWGQFRTEIPTAEEKISFYVSRAVSNKVEMILGILLGALIASFVTYVA